MEGLWASWGLSMQYHKQGSLQEAPKSFQEAPRKVQKISGQKFRNNFVGNFVQKMKPKGHFEINWPLSKRQIWVGDFFKYIDYYWPSPQILWPSAVPVKGVAHFSITLLTIFVSHYLNTLCAPKGFDEKKSKKPLSFFDTWRDGHANLNTRTKVIFYTSCGKLFLLVQSKDAHLVISRKSLWNKTI